MSNCDSFPHYILLTFRSIALAAHTRTMKQHCIVGDSSSTQLMAKVTQCKFKMNTTVKSPYAWAAETMVPSCKEKLARRSSRCSRQLKSRKKRLLGCFERSSKHCTEQNEKQTFALNRQEELHLPDVVHLLRYPRFPWVGLLRGRSRLLTQGAYFRTRK